MSTFDIVLSSLLNCFEAIPTILQRTSKSWQKQDISQRNEVHYQSIFLSQDLCAWNFRLCPWSWLWIFQKLHLFHSSTISHPPSSCFLLQPQCYPHSCAFWSSKFVPFQSSSFLFLFRNLQHVSFPLPEIQWVPPH